MSDLRSRNNSKVPSRPTSYQMKSIDLNRVYLISISILVATVTLLLSNMYIKSETSDDAKSSYISKLEMEISDKQKEIDFLINNQIPSAEKKGHQNGEKIGYAKGIKAGEKEKLYLRREIDSLKIKRKTAYKKLNSLLKDIKDVCKWIEKQDAKWPPRECKQFKE